MKRLLLALLLFVAPLPVLLWLIVHFVIETYQ